VKGRVYAACPKQPFYGWGRDTAIDSLSPLRRAYNRESVAQCWQIAKAGQVSTLKRAVRIAGSLTQR